ncbi:MAG TPA: hypothetical protein VHL10_02815 [Nitrososphaera sp.]|jgi:hypothetical protein|nr:hypothetical protein [Nitrososphaera sp.]
MKIWARLAALSLIVLGFTAVVHADTIVRGFKANVSLTPGFVVALDKTASGSVTAAPSNDPSRIYGVVIDPSQAPVTVNQSGNQIFVANSGAYPTFVSLSGGIIKPGDYISVSTADGIAAKAGQTQAYVLGQAIEKFDGKSGVITTSRDGYAIGKVAVNIIPGRNPLVKTDTAVPPFLRKLAQGVAGSDKNLTAARIYAALTIFLICALVAFGVLWIGIRSGMIAIGRNPLSRHSIMQSLVQVIIVALLVLITGGVGVYLLLKL